MRVVREAHRNLFQHAVPRHVHVAVAVDQDVFDGGIGEQILDRTEAREFFRQRGGDEAHLAFVERNAAQAHEAVHFQVDELVDRLPRPAAEFRAQFLDARKQMFVRRRRDVLKLLRLRERDGVFGQIVRERDVLAEVLSHRL
ncbi:hypothetical protein AWB71_06204 [Caballeronia peredens]|nr:hypothetical protein AWB71_06204 [Caballeronia peredens]